MIVVTILIHPVIFFYFKKLRHKKADNFIPQNIIDPFNAEEPVVRDYVLEMRWEEIPFPDDLVDPFIPEETTPLSKSIGKTTNLPIQNLDKLNKFLTLPPVTFVGFEKIDLTDGDWYQSFVQSTSKTTINPNLFDTIQHKVACRHPRTGIISHSCIGWRGEVATSLVFVENPKWVV